MKCPGDCSFAIKLFNARVNDQLWIIQFSFYCWFLTICFLTLPCVSRFWYSSFWLQSRHVRNLCHSSTKPSRSMRGDENRYLQTGVCLSHKRKFDPTELIPRSKPILLFAMTSREDRIARHTNAVNLARRYSVQNENDLLQVRFSRKSSTNAITFLA